MHPNNCTCSSHFSPPFLRGSTANGGEGVEFAEGGKVKKVIQRNLPLHKNYKLIDSYYTGGLTENPETCENCGRPIANVAILQDDDGVKYHVGMDCAETLASVKNSFEFTAAESEFNEAKNFRNKVKAIYKKHPQAILQIQNTYWGNITIKVTDANEAYLGSFSYPKQFVFKYLPDYIAKINNPDKNNFTSAWDKDSVPELKNFNIEPFKFKDKYTGPATLQVGEYTINVSRQNKSHTYQGKEITNNYIVVEAYKNGTLIGTDDFYTPSDIPTKIAGVLNKYEFDNYGKFAEGGDINSDKAFGAASRFKPYETIAFDPPITGPSGAKLIDYKWAYEWENYFNEFKGEVASRRISNWDQAISSADTGKNIVHQFTVLLPDGKTETVSAESALILLGYTERNKIKSFPSLINAAKTLAKQKMQLAIMEEQEKAYNELRTKLEKAEKPPIIEIEEPIEFVRKNRTENQDTVFGMGDAWNRQSNEYDYGTKTYKKQLHPTKSTIEQLTSDWINNRLKEANLQYPRGLYDLRKRVQRQERKIAELSKQASQEGQKLENGGNLHFNNKSTNFDYNLAKHEINNIISGISKVKYGDAIQTTAGYLRAATQASGLVKEQKQFKEQEAALLKQYATQNNLWVTDVDFSNLNKANEGAEQQVYFLNEHYVVKTNDGIFYQSWTDYFTSLLLHNYFFPGTAYQLLGFTLKDDILYSVVKQSAVIPTTETDLNQVKEFLTNKGFINKKANDYYHPQLGLILEDLHDENVLTKNGVLFFIDTVFYLKNTDMNFKEGGHITFNRLPKKELIGKKYKVVFRNEMSSPARYRAALKHHEATLKRLQENNYSDKRFCAADERKANWMKAHINKFEYMASIYLDNTGTIIDVKEEFKNGGPIDAKTQASEFINNLPPGEFDALVEKFASLIKERIVAEQVKLDDLLEQKAKLNSEAGILDKRDKETQDYQLKQTISEQKRNLRNTLKELETLILSQTNVVDCLRNGGTLISFTDKKGTEHNNIPDYRRIEAEFIAFSADGGEETILTDPLPPYIPQINEETFRSKGFVFDVIRIEKDGYLLSVSGFKEKVVKKEGYSYVETNEHPTDDQQGYVIVTLDQLALINEYYFAKAKAQNQKDAEDSYRRMEESYDKMPLEKREYYLKNRTWDSLPTKTKKLVTKQQWDGFTVPEKEKYYKPIKYPTVKRLTSKLEDKQMWVSFHQMYNRFVEPAHLPYKGKDALSLVPEYYDKESAEKAALKQPNTVFGHPAVFNYWYMFRDFLDWKIKDIKVQRETTSEIRLLAIETSFGESNTNDALKPELGILVKRQDGSQIKPVEIEQVKTGWEMVLKTFGNLAELATQNNLKISHTGAKYVFSSKAAGMYVPDKQTIAVSNKFGTEQFNSIMAHEVAHWIDNKLGQTLNKRYATDDFESTAGTIARMFRKNMNTVSTSDYTNATTECFARAMEQHFAISIYGDDATLIYNGKPLDSVRTYITEGNYVSKTAYYNQIKPLIEKFLTEHANFLKFGT